MTAVAEPPRLPREVPDWHNKGVCREFPELVDAWHDAKPNSPQAAAARVICAGCPVRMQCAIGALERGEPWGIWGGLDRRDRKAIALEYGYPVPAMLPEHGTNSRYAKHRCGCPECKAAHARYEIERRERVRREMRKRDLWRSPLAVEYPVKIGRVWVGVGQLLLPLGLPVPGGPARRAEPEQPHLTLVA